MNAGHEMRVSINDRPDFCALKAFNQHLYGTVGQLEHLQNTGDTTDFVKVVRGRIIFSG